MLLQFGCKKTENAANKIPITTNSKEARALYLKARVFENQQEMNNADLALNEAIALDSTFAMAYLMKGMISEDFNTRRDLVNKAMKYLPKVSEGEKLWILARNDFYGNGSDSEEIDLFNELVKLYPKDEYANYMFGFVNHHHGNTDLKNTIKHLKKAIEIKSDFTVAYNDLTYAYLEENDFENAKKTASKYIELLPHLPGPRDTKAEILMREGSYEESIKAYQDVLKIDPNFAWSIIGTAANLNYLDRHIEARKFLNKLDSIGKMSDYNYRHKWRSRVVSYIDEGKIDSALVVLENQKQMGIQKSTTHEPLFHAYYGFLRKTRLHFENGDWKSGLQEYEQWNEYVQNNSTRTTTKTRLKNLRNYYEAYSHFLQQNFSQAQVSLEKYSNSLDKENDQYLILKAKIMAATGKNNEALEIIKKTDLTDAYRQYQYAILLKKLYQNTKAEMWFEKIRNANHIDDISLALVRKKVQKHKNPLEQLSYYIGIWGPPPGHPIAVKNPKMKDLKVIDFAWGKDKKVIWSKTGFYSNQKKEVFSEGMITYNPNTKKIVWLEYQIDNELLFEGEYIPLGNNKFQRVYTVYYAQDYPDIPNPHVEGWTRKYRETFTPTSQNTIDWLTESLIDGKWIKQGQNNGDFKAVRNK